MANSNDNGGLQRLEHALQLADREWRTTFDSISDVIWVLDTDHRVLRCNKAIAEIFGKEPDEVVGHYCWEIVHQDGRPIDMCPAVRMRESLRRESVELRLDERWFHITVDPILSDSGELSGIIHIMRDITERRVADDALRESRERYRSLVESVNDWVWEADARPVFTYSSPRVRDMLGYEPEEVVGRSPYDFIVPEESESLQRTLGPIREKGEPLPTINCGMLRKDGRRIVVQISGAPILDDEGVCQGHRGVARDITELVLAEQQYRNLVDLSPVAIFVNLHGKFAFLNAEALAVFGASKPEDMIGKQVLDHVSPDHRESVRARIRAMIEKGAASVPLLQGSFLRLDGSRIDAEVAACRITYRGEVALLVVFRDITERVRSEKALQESEQKYRELVEITETGYLIVDTQGLVVDANAEYVRLTGRRSLEEIVGHSVLEWTADYDLERNAEEVRKCAETGTVRNLEIDYVSPCGRKITPIEINGTVIETQQGPRILTLCRDISERRRAEAALWESEKKFRTLFDSANDAIFIVDKDRFVDCNEKAVRMFGCTEKHEVIGQTPYFFSPARQPDGRDSKEKVIEKITAALSGVPQFFEWQHSRPDGTTFDTETSIHRVELQGKAVLQAIARDITDRKRAEAEKRAFYRQTILSVTEGKLNICDALDVQPYIDSAEVAVDLINPEDGAAARRMVAAACVENGLTGIRQEEFAIAVGEAITNAVKHGGRSRVFAGSSNGEVWAGISDCGPGIDSLILPNAVLRRGFSTKPSLGLGYTIMLEVADRVLLCTSSTGTTVILFKSIAEAPQASLADVVDTWAGIDPAG